MNPFMNMNNYNQQQMNMMMNQFMNNNMNNFQNMNMMNNNMMGMGGNNMMGMGGNNMMGMGGNNMMGMGGNNMMGMGGNNMMGMGNNNMIGMGNNNMMGMGNNMNDMFMMFQKWYQAKFANNKNNNMNNNNFQPNYMNNNNNNNTNTVDQGPKGILERGEKYLKFKVDDCDIRNINFKASSGLNVMISINKNKPLKDLFIEYAKRVGFPEFHLGKEIVFLFNALTIDVNDDKNTINSLFPKDSITITVIDQNEIIGAIN